MKRIDWDEWAERILRARSKIRFFEHDDIFHVPENSLRHMIASALRKAYRMGGKADGEKTKGGSK